jgi:hypothetical protein
MPPPLHDDIGRYWISQDTTPMTRIQPSLDSLATVGLFPGSAELQFGSFPFIQAFQYLPRQAIRQSISNKLHQTGPVPVG